MISSVRRAGIVLIASVLAIAGCSSDVDPQELHAAGRSLVPKSFRILREIESTCVEGKGSPSCVTVYVASKSSAVAKRARLIHQRARSQGWTGLGRIDYRRSGTRYERGEFNASVQIHERSAGWREGCSRLEGLDYLRTCADSIAVYPKP